MLRAHHACRPIRHASDRLEMWEQDFFLCTKMSFELVTEKREIQTGARPVCLRHGIFKRRKKIITFPMMVFEAFGKAVIHSDSPVIRNHCPQPPKNRLDAHQSADQAGVRRRSVM